MRSFKQKLGKPRHMFPNVFFLFPFFTKWHSTSFSANRWKANIIKDCLFRFVRKRNQGINYGCNGEETILRFTVSPSFRAVEEQQQKYEQSQPETPQLDYLGIHNNIKSVEYKCHPNLCSWKKFFLSVRIWNSLIKSFEWINFSKNLRCWQISHIFKLSCRSRRLKV